MHDSVFIMKREKKKRMMPRHMLTAAVLSGIVPMRCVSEDSLTI